MSITVLSLEFVGEDFLLGHHGSLPLHFGKPPLLAVLVRKISNHGVGASPGVFM